MGAPASALRGYGILCGDSSSMVLVLMRTLRQCPLAAADTQDQQDRGKDSANGCDLYPCHCGQVQGPGNPRRAHSVDFRQRGITSPYGLFDLLKASINFDPCRHLWTTLVLLRLVINRMPGQSNVVFALLVCTVFATIPCPGLSAAVAMTVLFHLPAFGADLLPSQVL